MRQAGLDTSQIAFSVANPQQTPSTSNRRQPARTEIPRSQIPSPQAPPPRSSPFSRLVSESSRPQRVSNAEPRRLYLRRNSLPTLKFSTCVGPRAEPGGRQLDRERARRLERVRVRERPNSKKEIRVGLGLAAGAVDLRAAAAAWQMRLGNAALLCPCVW